MRCLTRASTSLMKDFANSCRLKRFRASDLSARNSFSVAVAKIPCVPGKIIRRLKRDVLSLDPSRLDSRVELWRALFPTEFESRALRRRGFSPPNRDFSTANREFSTANRDFLKGLCEFCRLAPPDSPDHCLEPGSGEGQLDLSLDTCEESAS